MVNFRWRWLRPAALCAAAFAAAAQTPAPAGRRPDPLDAAAGVPATTHQSAFARHRRPADDKAMPWREANDTVARIGGWRAYAREAQQGPQGPAATQAQPARPEAKATTLPPAHGGHKMP
ncbi:hypothetical protein [Ideonella sp. A 288]|uniref:hypothetical protein n=1 Tax=Ideonella sp. A 288 TaxID=1962181 RepID=UPI000B4BDEED|nr:hypothetical protein [Ideonella sp. A 288]